MQEVADNSNVSLPESASSAKQNVQIEKAWLQKRTAPARNLTNVEAMMIILKATMGVGIVALPMAFMNAGLWTGFFGLFLAGAVQIHCMLLLVGTSRHLCDRLDCNVLAFDEVAKAAFQVGHKRLRWFSDYAGLLANGCLFLAVFGSDAVFLLFLGDSCQQIFEHYLNIDLHLQFWLLFAFILIALVFVFARTLKHMAWFSLVANVGMLVSLVIIFQHIVQDLPPASDYPILNSWRTLPLYLGTVSFCFDSVCVVLPTEHKVKHPEDYAGLTGVLNTAMSISVIFYAAMGFYGYLKYGDAVAASITLNLPMGWLYLSVRLLFCYSMFVSIGLELYVMAQILWPPVMQRLTNETIKNKGEYLIRFLLILGLYVVAATVPYLDLMVSLTGALTLTMTNLIIPASLDLVIWWSGDTSRLHWRLVKDILIIITGFLVVVIGTGVALVEVIQGY